jgi:PPK2 family polyphosphate:nucleotide phosphotransferase
MSGVNPQGCEVYAFKQPSSEELDHDYLWRCAKLAPRRGHIGIFNRSYYEEVIVVRVHSELLLRQKLPPSLRGKDIWERRHEEIRNYEDYLTDNAIVVRKFFLYVSKEEQRRRFLARLDSPDKLWKFSPGDVQERRHWGEYMRAYESAIQGTATKKAPWYVVPADHKWFTRLVVASVIIETMDSLKLKYPSRARLWRASKPGLGICQNSVQMSGQGSVRRLGVLDNEEHFARPDQAQLLAGEGLDSRWIL